MPKLVALIDGSMYSHSVCDLSAFFASRLEASISVVHVLGRREVPGKTANLSGSIGLGARTALLEELADMDSQNAKLANKRGRAILEDAREYLQDAGIKDVEIKLRNAEIVETIADFESEVDLIVIGKRGVGANFDEMHLGSNLERVVRSTQKPVLVASRAFRPIKRFLIAFDGGNSAWKAVEYAAQLKCFADVPCHLITINNGSTSSKAGLEQAETLMRDAGYEVTSEVLDGDAEYSISKKVEEGEFDLLLMGAYGHSRIRNLIIGSTTTEMIRSCKVPVLLFR